MSFIRWLGNHRRSLLLLVAALTVAGFASLPTTPVSLFPRTTFPRVRVEVDAGDRPADRMTIEVTRPLEEAIRGVLGVRDVRSTTTRGTTDISVTFDWGADMISEALQVNAAISRVLPTLPPGISYDVRRMNPTVYPVIGLSLSSPKRPLIELRDRALYDLRPRLSAVRGVAKIGVVGGRTEEIQVLVDPLRLDAAGLTLDDVVRAVSAENVIEAVGRLEQNEKLYLILSDAQFKDLRDLSNVVLRKSPKGVVQLEDVATILDAPAPQWTRVEADGEKAVIVDVYQQPDGNTVQIEHDIQAELARYKAAAPKDLRIHTWYDQADLITSSASSLRDSVLIGVLLAILVLWLFLRDWRVTLAASVAVPVVLAITALVLKLTGRSLNIMTLGGMAAAVGLVIDDGIVMVEHGVRRLREGAGARSGALLAAGREMASPLTGSSLATIVVFAPLAFLGGVTGAFFKALSFTMATALAVSYLFAFLIIPLFSDTLLAGKIRTHEDMGPRFRRVITGYERVLRTLLRRPLWVLFGVLPLLALGVLAYHEVGTGFMPEMDEGGFVLDYRAPSGTSLTETDRRLRHVERILATIPEIASYSRRTGLQLGGGITEANEGDYFIRLKPGPRRSIDVIMDEVRRQVQAEVPGLEIELSQLMEDLIGDLTAVPQPIEVKLFGADPSVLRGEAPAIEKALSSVPGVVDIKSGVVLAGDALDIRVDRLKAKMLGLDPNALTRLAEVALGGVVTTEVQRGEKMVGIRVWTDHSLRSRIDKIADLPLLTAGGTRVRLGRVATLTTEVGQPQITRENLKTMVPVTARISGRDMGSVMQDVKAAIGRLSLPPGAYVQYGGLYKEQQASFRGLLAVLVAAILLVFVLMLYLYERFSAPLAIMATVLLASTAVFSGLWWTHTELNITSMMGLTMIIGISSESAIFYVSQWHELKGELSNDDALVRAGALRFRPVLMTALTAILALLPLTLGIGQGSAMLEPLAIAIIAGLVLKVPAVLLGLPVALKAFGRRKIKGETARTP
jgi:CzcA family heavy metal efflux pump